VVPRAWALTWLAGAHRDPPDETPPTWRERWGAEAGRFGLPGMPESYLDAPNAGLPIAGEPQRAAEERSLVTLARVRAAVLPRLVREAEDRGWWSPSSARAGHAVSAAEPDPALAPAVDVLTGERLRSLSLAPRVIPPFDPADTHDLLAAALRDGARAVAAVSGSVIVGIAVAVGSATEPATESLLALGVAPAFRGDGLGRALLRALLAERPPGVAMEARVGVAERDVVEPWSLGVRLAVARRLLAGSGFAFTAVSPDLVRDDPSTLLARLAAR
jgi:ribosomal protein S18 acetylase RimI-like enzyme